jgi:hypothetical protein
LKKRSKKLLLLWAWGVCAIAPMPQINESLFGSFSSEKEQPYCPFPYGNVI